MKKACKVLVCLSVVCALSLLMLQYRDSSPLYQSLAPTKGFVTIEFTNGRMGNKLFHLIDGYALARDLNRLFYLRSKEMSWLKDGLDEILNAFPKLNSTFTVISKDIDEQQPGPYSPYSATNVFNATWWKDEPAEYLHVNIGGGQNWNCFGNYDEDVREMLEFSEAVRREGDSIRRTKQLSQSSLCVHIRRTDFVSSNSGSMMESTYAMTEMLLKHQKLRSVAFFGDDNSFMRDVVKKLDENRMLDENGGFVSEFSPGMDLYLSSRLCHSFLISAPVSTFGFWLGYVIPNQQNVFYRIDDGNQMGKQITRDLFQPSWRPLKVFNDTIVLLVD